MAARCHFVQYWLPEMCSGTVHQVRPRPPAPAEPVAEPGDEFQPRRAAADDHDVMKGLACRELVGLLRHQFTFGSASPHVCLRFVAGISLGRLSVGHFALSG